MNPGPVSNDKARLRNPDLWFFLLITVLVLWRIFFIKTCGLDLSPDEAYYWDWSRHLDWGYYSKPPMVAWIIWLSTKLFGNTVIGVRIPAVVLGTLSLVPIYLLANRLYDKGTGLLACVIVVSCPGSCLSGFIMTIDPPLLFFWALGLFCFWQALQQKDRHLGWWFITGIVTGLGLLSKQTMIAFWAFCFVYLLMEPAYRKRFKGIAPYVSVTLFLSSLTPVIFWNLKHQWITLRHTAHHFQGVEKAAGLSLHALSTFLVSQLGALSPITFVLILITGFSALILVKNLDKRARFIFSLSILPLAAVILLSLKQKVNANWPAPFYLAWSVGLSAWYLGYLSLGKTNRIKSLFPLGLALGILLSVGAYGLTYLLNDPTLSPKWPVITRAILGRPMPDPLYRLKGWKELGQQIDRIILSLPNRKRLFVFSKKRQTVSELAFYLHGNPVVYRWTQNREIVRSQYEIWQGPKDKLGWDGLFVIKSGKGLPEGIKEFFESVRFLSKITVPCGVNKERAFEVYLCKELIKSW